MAEAVKNNVRRRRPPSHLREGYNQDNFEPIGSTYSTRGDQYKQNADPFPVPTIARLLAKFLNSANKKLNQSKLKRSQQELTLPPKKQAVQQSKFQIKAQRIGKEDKQGSSLKIQDNLANRQSMIRQQPPRYQERAGRQITNLSPSQPLSTGKQTRNQPFGNQTPVKNPLSGDAHLNIESMNKMSRQQFLKLMPKGYDKNLFKQQLMLPGNPLKIMSKFPQNMLKQGMRTNEFRQDTKLFKRASFHVGIAYNIHIENIRQKNPNFSPQELDPTYVSRKLKMQSTDFVKKQNEQNQKLRIQQQWLLKQKQQQTMEAQRMKQRQEQQMKKQNISSDKKDNMNKEMICIDLEENEGGKQIEEVKNGEQMHIQENKVTGYQEKQIKPQSHQQQKNKENKYENGEPIKDEFLHGKTNEDQPIVDKPHSQQKMIPQEIEEKELQKQKQGDEHANQ